MAFAKEKALLVAAFDNDLSITTVYCPIRINRQCHIKEEKRGNYGTALSGWKGSDDERRMF